MDTLQVEITRPAFLRRMFEGFAIASAIGLVLSAAVLVFPGMTFHGSDGELVTRAYFITHFWLPLAPLIAWSTATAYALWKHKPWSRPLIAIPIALLALALWADCIRDPDSLGGAAGWSVIAVGLWWYLYRKANVRGYYHTIRDATHEACSAS